MDERLLAETQDDPHRPGDVGRNIRAVALDRYVVLDPLGAGAMGTVFGAWDRKLERRVALKLLHPGHNRERFLREAQLAAKLKHPNVVTVFDVGLAEEDAFIAMELVEGTSLRRWLEERPRAPREILAAFLAAGRGLAAAHAAGLVHRDFKPDNVLMGADGVARVADFGLALWRGARAEADSTSGSGPGRLTATGQVVGTPRYMAPEQSALHAVDPRADQYSFAVSLWEALYRSHPVFDARRPPPSRTRRALERALDPRPEARWPSMEALLAELDRPPVWRRRAAWLAAAAFAAVAALALALALAWPRRSEVCSGGARRLAGVWDPRVRRATQAAFLATGRPYAGDTFDRTARLLDDYSGRWLAMFREACEATAVRKEQSAALLDLRMACLDRRADELRALTGLLAQGPSATQLEQAVGSVGRLEDLGGCADAETLSARLPLPRDPARRAALALLRVRLDQTVALRALGQYRTALPLAKQSVDEARRLAYAPLLAEALFLLGSAQAPVDGPAAEASLAEALLVAGAAHDRRRVAQVLIELIATVGYSLGRPAEALGIARPAEAIIAELGDEGPLLAGLLSTKGRVLVSQHREEEALPLLERSVTLFEATGAPLQTASALVSLGNALRNLYRSTEAAARFRQARAIYERIVGPDDLLVGGALMNEASAVWMQGDEEAAVKLLRRAIAIQEARLGPTHPDLGRSLNNLGELLLTRGDVEEAAPLLERSLDIKTRSLPADHPQLASTLYLMGELQRKRGRPADGLAYAERGLAIREKAFGDGLITAQSLRGLGALRAAEGRCDAALPILERALAMEQKAPGLRDEEMAMTLRSIGDCQAGARQWPQAAQTYERELRAWLLTIPPAGVIDEALGRLTRARRLAAGR